MPIEREKYTKHFVDEGLEIIKTVETLVFDIKDGVSVEDDLATLLRGLHTMKGSSRMLEYKRIEDLSHSLESVFVAVREQRIGLSENAVKLVLSSLDLLKTAFNGLFETKDDDVDVHEYVKNLTLLASNEEYSLVNINKDALDSPAKTSAALKQEAAENTQPEKKRDSKHESIRLSLEKIDGIIKSIATLQTLEIQAKSIWQSSIALSAMIKEFSVVFKSTGKPDPVMLSDIRKFERSSERLGSALRNYAIDAGNSIRGAYDSVISLRTLPVSTIFDSYPRYIYQLSQELGKKVQLNVEGKENEIDKNIIESMSDVFLHMVRNALDHGLETPQERIASGKNETGNLSIICSRESGSMKIIISDDGRGLDHEKIRKKAVKEGFVSEVVASGLTKEDLTNFIFQSGFSTSKEVSGVSGRGVGMDVVRETVESLKGSIVVESAKGEGTIFTIMVPLSIAALMGFPVECSGMKFIIPANFVDNIILLNREDIITVVDRPEIKYNDRIIKLYYLSQILHIKEDIGNPVDIIFIVIIRSYEDIAALAVDNIESMRSVILKTMPAFMEHINVFSGIILNEDYEMVSVLHVPTIIKMAKRVKTIDIKKRNIELERSRKTILVVDDSLPTREIESEILQSEGYNVDTASDGAQALKAAKQKHYDLICTDLNMPVMDGFMLIENIRNNDELADIPIIVISSIAVEEERQRVFSLGASGYIIKNSFNNQNLLENVKELIGGSGER